MKIKPPARTDISVLNRWWWSVDRWTLMAFVVLMMFGILLVSAASPPVAERLGLSSFYFLYRHLFMLVPTFILLIGASLLKRRDVWRLSLVMFGVGAFLTFLTPFVGEEVKGATRWIHVFGFSLQPSEFLKPALAVVTAWLLALQHDKPGFPGFQISCGALAIVVGLLLLQPDIGMTFVMCCIWAAEVFITGFPLPWVFLMGVVGAAGLFGTYFVFPHFTSRMDRFLDPSSGDTYQVQKSLEAFSEGGLFGKGPGHGDVKLRLPDAHADFIFAVAGEELGLITALILVAIFVFIILRSLKRARGSSDMFAILAVGGLMTQFGLQTFIHMSSSLQLLPAKGMTLPFISYGGSSLLALGLGMGMLLALTRRSSGGQT